MNNYEESADEFLKTDFKSGSNDFFKAKEGENKIRLLSSMKPYFSKFVKGGKGSIKAYSYFTDSSSKFLCYVLDLADNKIKLYEMPKTVATEIQALGKDEDYAFSSFPMPYNIKIMVENAGTTAVEYKVIASPKQIPIEPEVLEDYATKKKVHEVLATMIKRSEENQPKENLDVIQMDDPIIPGENKGKGGMITDGIDYGDSINPEDIPF
jgi:hypothetical protein